MEEAANTIKKLVKRIGKSFAKVVLTPTLATTIIIVLIAGSAYFILQWIAESVNQAATAYTTNVTINADGTISTEMSAQELWNQMKKAGYDVDKYLKKPQELEKLLNAELITQLPDTRSNVEEAINWEAIFQADKNASQKNNIQGIIKFKRHDNDGKERYLTYVEPEVFYEWQNEYSTTDSSDSRQSAMDNIMNHYTLIKKSSTSSSTSNVSLQAAENDLITDISEKIVQATKTTPWSGAGLCLNWVDNVYENAGVSPDRLETARIAGNAHIISTDKTKIPIGAAVYGEGSGDAGHVGIYIGNGQVMDNRISGLTTSSLDEFLQWQSKGNPGSWLGWGWEDGNKTRGTTETSTKSEKKTKSENSKTSSKTSTSSNYTGQLDTSQAGNGYPGTYTSSTGFTYKAFKQYQGDYASQHYWGGTISGWGCGPSSVAVLASGLHPELNYTPGDTAGIITNQFGDISTDDALKNLMDTLGMPTEIIYSPSVEDIKNQLKQGKVMMLLEHKSDGSIFPMGEGHFIAAVDINENNQIFVINPGGKQDADTGWYDAETVAQGCSGIWVTDSGKIGVASVSNGSTADSMFGYQAVVATWNRVERTTSVNAATQGTEENVAERLGVSIENDPSYTMSTTTINYEEMVRPYTLSFDLLWSLLVIGQSKGFVMDLADLAYNSEIEVSVYDNLTTITDIDNFTYKEPTNARVSGSVSYHSNDSWNVNKRENIEEHEHKYPDDPYDKNVPSGSINKKVVTYNNTVSFALTKAHTWIADYDLSYEYNNDVGTDHSEVNELPDQSHIYGSHNGWGEDSCEVVQQAIDKVVSEANKDFDDLKELAEKVAKELKKTAKNSQGVNVSTARGDEDDVVNIQGHQHISAEDVDKSKIFVTTWVDRVDINQTTLDRTDTQKYTALVPTLKINDEKKNVSKEKNKENFVTLFNKRKYRANKNNILSAPEWLFEILEKNDKTKNMVDVIKYLLYKATGTSYGVTNVDDIIDMFYPGNLNSVGGNFLSPDGSYIVDTTKSPKEIVITDKATLEKAFSGYPTNSKLIAESQSFLDMQEKYHVNAVFAAAVSVIETTAGTAGYAVSGHQWFNYLPINNMHKGGAGPYAAFSNDRDNILGFGEWISDTTGQVSCAFGAGNFTVYQIGYGGYCEPPDDWVNNVNSTMTQMFNAAGINPTMSSGASVVDGSQASFIIQRAKTWLGMPYSLGSQGPNYTDCSGLVNYAYTGNIGAHGPGSSEMASSWTPVPVSEAKPGDTLVMGGVHAALIIEDMKVIEADGTQVVINGPERFTNCINSGYQVVRPPEGYIKN